MNLKDKKPKLVVILGPTASGKTSLSIKLAKKFEGEIVSADSRQVYKGMDIGTGKVTPNQAQQIPHYLLDVVSPKEKFNVAQYKKMAFKAINKILEKNKIPFLVGGSPFYIYSVVEGFKFPEVEPKPELRRKLRKKSVSELFKILNELDPRRAKTIEKENKRRLIRAIEIAKQKGEVPKLKKEPKYKCLLIGIKKAQKELKPRISNRVEKMFDKGLEKEVKRLVKNYGWSEALHTIGYQEFKDYFQQKIKKEELKEKIKIHTSQFAKRQMAWFKKDDRINWIENEKEAEQLIKDFLN